MHSLRLEPRRDWELPSQIPNAYLPATATVLLKQHAGQAARCVVKAGDLVREGMVLGVPEGASSAYVHSPIPGRVRSLSRIRLPAGSECDAVEILLGGSFDRLGKRPERYVWRSMRRLDILQALKNKGVVETRSPGRPLDELLEAQTRRSRLLVLALDEEPYLRSETAVMASRAREVLEGARIVASVTEAVAISFLVDGEVQGRLPPDYLGADAKEGEAPSLELHRVPPFLPGSLGGARGASGPELLLLPSTLLAVYEAVVEAKSFVERHVTVAGAAIRRPAVLKARIGTPIGDLIEECGGFLETPERLVLGGPLTGLPARDLDMPVTKTVGAVLALTPPETRGGRPRPCIRCGRCREHCPVSIDPERIHRDLLGGRVEAARTAGLGSCISCGLCSYVCPSRIELSQGFTARLGVRQ